MGTMQSSLSIRARVTVGNQHGRRSINVSTATYLEASELEIGQSIDVTDVWTGQAFTLQAVECEEPGCRCNAPDLAITTTQQ